MAINKLFDISRSSLFAYQQALSITSGNIANANNPNYSRQQVVLGTLPPDYRAKFAFGTGVTIDQVVRVKNNITENQLRNYYQKFYASDKHSEILGKVETLFSEPSELGLSNFINEFFNSWDELAVNPGSGPLRNNVIQSAQKLSSKVQSVYEGLDLLRSDLKEEGSELVNSVNYYLDQIKVLNSDIYQASITGVSANDLLDDRDAVINELSKLVNINVSIDNNNIATISIGGVFAVDRVYANHFKLVEENGRLSVKSEDENSKVALTGGEIFAVVDTYSNKIPQYYNDIDAIMNQMVQSVNELHSSGYTNTEPPQTGINFFEGYSHGVLIINQDILDDPNLIAASGDGTSGNNEIALALAELKNQGLVDGKTFSEKYTDLVSNIGHQKQLNEQNANSFGLVIEQLELQKSSESGVSIDEEMINVMRFQRAYDAAAKLIKVADELLETIVNMV